MKRIKKLWDMFAGIRLRERMLLFYLVGGILPLLLANIYMYRSTRAIMIEQAKENSIEELEVIADSIEESISITERVSKQLYFDKNIEHIAFTNYEQYADILEDYSRYDNIGDYLNNYYQEIASITICTYNVSLSNNEHFIYADAITKSNSWYTKTMNLAGKPYWSFQNDSLTKKNCLTLSRVLYTEDFETVGVAYITMQNKRSELLVTENSADTMLFYNDTVVLHSNCTDLDYDEVSAMLLRSPEESASSRVKYKGDNYLMTYVRIRPDFSDNGYTVVSMIPYSEISALAAKNLFGSLILLLLCASLAFVLISLFSYSFSARINEFKAQMHRAATGDFRIAEKLSGSDEIAELYQDLNAMIFDIQELMEKVVQEQVQKEQLNTRQKEVEFKMLASQINPHFLYNTLETIRMQARVKKQPEIEELAKMLAKIMRHNIQVGDSLQPVAEELRLVQYYLKIQDYRFHDRISYEIDADETAIAPYRMMPLLMQPFVENAFVHGLESKESNGLIRIVVEVRTHLWITISDNGCGMTAQQLEEVNHMLNDFENLDRTHIGICNVNQRIKLQYGDDYGVHIDSAPGEGTQVTIRLPLLTG